MAMDDRVDPERPPVQRGELGDRRAPGKPRRRQSLPSRDLARSADVYYKSGATSAVRNDALDRSTHPGEEPAGQPRRPSPLQDRNTDKYYREQPRPRPLPDLPQRPRATAPAADTPRTNPLRAARQRPAASAGPRARNNKEDDMAAKRRRLLDTEPVPMTVPRLQPGKFKMIDVGDSKDEVRAAIPRVVELVKAGHQVRVTVPRKRALLLRTLMDYQRTREEVTADEYARFFLVIAAEAGEVTAPAPAGSAPEAAAKRPAKKAAAKKQPGKKQPAKKGADPLRQAAEPVTIDDLLQANADEEARESKQSAAGLAAPTEVVGVDDEFLLRGAE